MRQRGQLGTPFHAILTGRADGASGVEYFREGDGFEVLAAALDGGDPADDLTDDGGLDLDRDAEERFEVPSRSPGVWPDLVASKPEPTKW